MDNTTSKQTNTSEILGGGCICGNIDPTTLLFWAIIILLLIVIIYNYDKIKSKKNQSVTESYFSGRPNQILATKQLARQEQGASIGESQFMGELDLQNTLY